MKEIINKILDEVDPDIRDVMLRIEECNGKREYRNWELLHDPANAILNWQSLRDRNRV